VAANIGVVLAHPAEARDRVLRLEPAERDPFAARGSVSLKVRKQHGVAGSQQHRRALLDVSTIRDAGSGRRAGRVSRWPTSSGTTAAIAPAAAAVSVIPRRMGRSLPSFVLTLEPRGA
jgi:hypothetical protein